MMLSANKASRARDAVACKLQSQLIVQTSLSSPSSLNTHTHTHNLNDNRKVYLLQPRTKTVPHERTGGIIPSSELLGLKVLLPISAAGRAPRVPYTHRHTMRTLAVRKYANSHIRPTSAFDTLPISIQRQTSFNKRAQAVRQPGEASGNLRPNPPLTQLNDGGTNSRPRRVVGLRRHDTQLRWWQPPKPTRPV